MFWGPNKPCHRPLICGLSLKASCCQGFWTHLLQPTQQPMWLAWQGLIPGQTSGPTGLEGQSERTEVGGQGPGSPPQEAWNASTCEGGQTVARAMFLQLGTSDHCTGLGVVLGKQVLGPPRQTRAVREIPGVQFTSFLQQKAPQPESRGALFPVRLSLCACPCSVLEPCEQATAAASRVGWGPYHAVSWEPVRPLIYPSLLL